jgi:hypothetical protein
LALEISAIELFGPEIQPQFFCLAGALPGVDETGSLSAIDLPSALPMVDIADAHPTVDTTDDSPTMALAGALPTIDIAGAHPTVEAAGAFPTADVAGALPMIDEAITGILHGGSTECGRDGLYFTHVIFFCLRAGSRARQTNPFDQDLRR